MDEPLKVQLVRMDNGELWFFKYTDKGLEPHRKVKEIIEGEVITTASEEIVS